MTIISEPIGLFDLDPPKRKGNTRVTGKEQYYTPLDLA
ncbi:MAG: hypothetical protein RL612_822, partial [Actinomycetota bacterium]